MIDTRLAPYGALLLRVALGLMFIAHAYLKLAIFTVPRFCRFLGQIGLPQIPRLADHPGRDCRRRCLDRRLPCPPRIAGAAAGPARRTLISCAEWLALHRAQWRLGISRLPRGRGVDPGPDRRRRLALAHQRALHRRSSRNVRREHDWHGRRARRRAAACSPSAASWRARPANCSGTISA